MDERTLVDNRDESRYELRLDDKPASWLVYQRIEGRIALLHTETDPAYEGRGLGSALIRGVLDAARADGTAVLPYCPFVRTFLGRHPEYQDLVPAEERERFGL